MKLIQVLLLKGLLISFVLTTSGNALAQSSVSLDRMVSQIESMYPPLKGVVIEVEGTGLTLDLRQGMPVQPGDRLKLIRYGRELFHPTTKKKIGRKETDLGEVEILEVRKDYSLARTLDPTVLTKVGDGVRSAFQKLSFLVAPPQVKSKQKINADRLRYNLESRINRHPRFNVPSFDLGLWMIDEKLSIQSIFQSRNLEKLRGKVEADFILVPSVRTLKGKMALHYKLVSTLDGSLKKQADIMTDNLSAQDAPREYEGETQLSFDKKNALFKFIGKEQFPYEVVDFDVGDLNGDGKNEVVLIDRYRVMIFKQKKDRFIRFHTIRTNKTANHFLTVDVGDINGNGRDEIFITNQVGDELESFSLETRTKQKGFHYTWKNANLYFRIIRPIGKRPILMSQSPGFQNPFRGPIRKVFFKNGKYQQGPKLNTPKVHGTHFILYGLTQEDLNGDGVPETVVLDSDSHLRVYSPRGKVLVKSSEYYGDDPRQIDLGVEEDASGIVQQGEPVQFKNRLEFFRAGSGRYLAVPHNRIFMDGLLERLIVIENSGISFLEVTREGFREAYRTDDQKGYIGTFRVVQSKDNSVIRLYVLHVEPGNWVGVGKNMASSKLTVYEWTPKK